MTLNANHAVVATGGLGSGVFLQKPIADVVQMISSWKLWASACPDLGQALGMTTEHASSVALLVIAALTGAGLVFVSGNGNGSAIKNGLSPTPKIGDGVG